MFKFFRRSTPQQPTLESLVAQYRARSEVASQLARAKSLDQLGRSTEASALRTHALANAREYAEKNPFSKDVQLLLAIYLVEAGDASAAQHLTDILGREKSLGLSKDECAAISGQLLALQRNQPAPLRPDGAPKSFTQVYSCMECGRLHHFLSLPCPECDWYPVNRREVAEGLILSNAHVDVSTLIRIGRRIAAGESPDKFVGNLSTMAQVWLDDPQRSQVIDRVLEVAQRDAQSSKRNVATLRQCPNCNGRVTFSAADTCEHCGNAVAWPKRLRALICIDSLLYWFEQRVEPSNQPEFSEFVCVLVFMLDLMLRKQEPASDSTRQHALQLLHDLKAIWDMDQGALISTEDLEALQICLVQDRMREDSKPFAQIIAAELQQFVQHMKQGNTLYE